MTRTKTDSSFGASYDELRKPWRNIMFDIHVRVAHRMADEFDPSWREQWSIVKSLCVNAHYAVLFTFLEHIIRHPYCPTDLPKAIARDFEQARAAYTIVDKTIFPKVTEEEGEAIRTAFADLSAHGLNGAKTHLRTAGERLNEGNYADSIRESIHAVEAVARTLDPDASTLGPALAALGTKLAIHPALKRGFSNIYGYTSDEDGIRHPLVDTDEAAVDETDAVFMIGACASFISYLIGKAEGAGISVR